MKDVKYLFWLISQMFWFVAAIYGFAAHEPDWMASMSMSLASAALAGLAQRTKEHP